MSLGTAARSVSPPSLFDRADDRHDHDTEPTTALGSGSDEPSYDLKPPAPSISHDNIEALSERFFSLDHLDVILRDHNLAARFTRFLNQYRPQHAQALTRYRETKKAMAAVEYANAIAEQILAAPGHPPYVAATLDEQFEVRSSEIAEDLVDDALPAYITHRLVTLVTDTLVKEITGNNAPIMRELIPSLAEVYCVTDPSLRDNPIVYASEGEWPQRHMRECRRTNELTWPRRRILQYHPIRPRIHHRPELPLPPRPQVLQLDRATPD